MNALGLDEWFEVLVSFRQSAFHVEQHLFYAGDLDAMVPWLAGAVDPPAPGEGHDPWAEATRPLLAGGARLERVRIHRASPTPYQRWLRWISPRRLAGGEVHRYLTDVEAERHGLLPVRPFEGCDWWLLDENQLLVFHHDDGGHLVAVEQTESAAVVDEAAAWWREAIVHAEVEAALSVRRVG